MNREKGREQGGKQYVFGISLEKKKKGNDNYEKEANILSVGNETDDPAEFKGPVNETAAAQRKRHMMSEARREKKRGRRRETTFASTSMKPKKKGNLQYTLRMERGERKRKEKRKRDEKRGG